MVFDSDEVFDMSIITILKGVLNSILYLFYNFSIFVFFLYFGFRFFLKNRRKELFWILLLIIPHYLFYARYDVNDSYVFYQHVYLIMAIFLAAGLKVLSIRFRLRKYIYLYMLLFFLLNPVTYQVVLYAAKQNALLYEIEQKKKWKGGLEYYIYPGMKNAKDPYEMVLHWYNNETPDSANNYTWGYNFDNAVYYLKYTGRTDGKPLPP